ncbi:MAG: hypothetical protein HUU55_07700 [Myxococcales bacterium]|nr:hypothetical protein [Myxococcales bacterium]
MRDNIGLTARGKIRVLATRASQVLMDDTQENLVLGGSAEIITRAVGGAAESAVAYIGVGNGTAAPSTEQTGLSGDGFNAAVTAVTYPSANEVVFTAEVGEGDANDLLGITEFVLFTGDFRAFSRRVRTPAIPKTNEIQLTIEWTLTITSVDAGA